MGVIIIGKGSGWHNAPYAISDGEIWGVNDICLRRTVHLAFNMHDLSKYGKHYLFNKTIDYVNKHKIPIVTQKQYTHIPTSIIFPLEYFWEVGRRYFTNSIDYMVAYALFRGDIEHIDMFGVVMALDSEYMEQRASLEYWIGVFEGQGGVVTIHSPTTLCHSPKGLYGYDWDDEEKDSVKAREENQPK